MPKNKRKNKVSRPIRSNNIIYADKSLKQQYAKITKSHGGRPPKFVCSLLNGQERIASLPSGKAREAKQKGIIKVNPDHWVLVQPLSTDPDGMQEIVTVYTQSQHKQLEKENLLTTIQEIPQEEELVTFEGSKPKKILIEEIDIDDL